MSQHNTNISYSVATFLISVSLSEGWITELLVWVPEMICTIWPNPRPGVETQYVGRWIVVSILGQLWANLRMFERLWQESQRKHCFLAVHILLPNCLVFTSWKDFWRADFCVSPPICHVITGRLNVPKVAVWNISGKAEQVAQVTHQMHSSSRYMQSSPLPGGCSLLGRHATMSLSKLMSQECITACYLYCCC